MYSGDHLIVMRTSYLNTRQICVMNCLVVSRTRFLLSLNARQFAKEFQHYVSSLSPPLKIFLQADSINVKTYKKADCSKFSPSKIVPVSHAPLLTNFFFWCCDTYKYPAAGKVLPMVCKCSIFVEN